MTERQRRRFDNGTPNNAATDALYQKQGMYNLVHAEIGIAQPSAVALQSTGGGTARDNGGGVRSTSKFRTKYWRFDHVAPAFSIGSTPKSLVLPSIPPERRLPPSRFNSVSAYFHEKYASHPAEAIPVLIFCSSTIRAWCGCHPRCGSVCFRRRRTWSRCG